MSAAAPLLRPAHTAAGFGEEQRQECSILGAVVNDGRREYRRFITRYDAFQSSKWI